MTQITEDYVSYETAVLLEEKGFDEPYRNCYLLLDEGGYTEVEMSDECHQGERYDSESSSWKFGTLLLRPTHQMALKWLREVHNIAIDTEWEHLWYAYVKPMTSNPFEDDYYQCSSVKYEEAVEAAILYVLKNLIRYDKRRS